MFFQSMTRRRIASVKDSPTGPASQWRKDFHVLLSVDQEEMRSIAFWALDSSAFEQAFCAWAEAANASVAMSRIIFFMVRLPFRGGAPRFGPGARESSAGCRRGPNRNRRATVGDRHAR